MKVLSIMQPWAMLIVLGVKQFETRSWSTKHRGQLAIHSSKKIDKFACRQEPICSLLAKHGYTAKNLPIGVILATSHLSDCIKVILDTGASARLDDGRLVTGIEYYFGNFSEGRLAWEIQHIKKLDKYVPAKGQLGLWNHTITTPHPAEHP
ncbi:2-oxoglutarate dehydrogenase E1 [Bacillus canaveralius]|uniref:2-oxoglutarate dehydrogenase E1 n=1 Tax=Bacillus canaveralius TaxID=1403243 RepID=A0A2N5GN06_9BACI|nr:ASCH domain-containing protein [Bacillus canaveralius]PLR83466.1 2-oxoglutarate dehydrogenase E1 [Bacillus canaveralius]PLR95353.1 2-oxoglutarate dehydrogenase E1 [Bacillus canaveralius]